MSNRYEIQDILAQDASGVVFRVVDRESGRDVVLRRFFPFGADGGGLEEEERMAYEIAVRRLMSISHPALRRVLDGGTDPVDGMPFLVTEWLEGVPLSRRVAERPISAGSARVLADLAMETSRILSETFQEESVWVDTSLESIILGEEDERQLTFWISPLRWLGHTESHGLRPILEMVEEATGWRGRVVPDEVGEGFGAWLRRLRENPDDWTLAQARHALHYGPALTPPPTPTATVSITRETSGPPAGPTAAAPPPPSPPQPKGGDRSMLWPWLVAGLITLAAAAFIFTRTLPAPAPDPAETAAGNQESAAAPEEEIPAGAPSPPVEGERSAAEEPGMTAAERASARASAIAAEVEDMTRPADHHRVRADMAAENERLTRIGRELRRNLDGRDSLTAVVRTVRASDSGKTLYVEFGSAREDDTVCARYRTSRDVFDREDLDALIGEKVRVEGPVVGDPSGRIAIDLKERADIRAVTGE